MKNLCNILIILIVQIFAIALSNPVTLTNNNNNNETEVFLKYCQKELNSLAEDFCENVKVTSERLLNDKDFKTPQAENELKELKLWLQEFLRDYPHLKRYGNYDSILLLIRLITKTNNSYDLEDNNESDVKLKKLFLQHFGPLMQKYTENYQKFFKHKILPQLEEFSKKYDDRKQLRIYEKLMGDLKNCHDFHCLPESTNYLVQVTLFNKETVLSCAVKDYEKMINLIFISTYNRSKLLLKDPLLLKLSAELKTNFTLDVEEYMRRFENNNNTKTFILAVKDNFNLPKKYLTDTDFPQKDQEILKELFEKYSKKSLSRYDKAISSIMEMWSVSMVLFFVYDPNAISENYHYLLEYQGF